MQLAVVEHHPGWGKLGLDTAVQLGSASCPGRRVPLVISDLHWGASLAQPFGEPMKVNIDAMEGKPFAVGDRVRVLTRARWLTVGTIVGEHTRFRGPVMDGANRIPAISPTKRFLYQRPASLCSP